ncbi:AAA-family ATPase [Fragilaria crotonensis]|nr:AAA-family ATPase [Fragilaria crotonensis]
MKRNVRPVPWLSSLLLLALYLLPIVIITEGKPESLSFLRKRRWFPLRPFQDITTPATDTNTGSSRITTSSSATTTTNTASSSTSSDNNHSKLMDDQQPQPLDSSSQQSPLTSTDVEISSNSTRHVSKDETLLVRSKPLFSVIRSDEQQEQQQQFSSDVSVPSNNNNNSIAVATNWIGGAVAAVIQNPRVLAKWGLTGLQVGILYFLGHAVWQAAQDVLLELEEQTGAFSGTGAVLKPNVVEHVLEDLDQQRPATDHFALYRIAQRLQFVTGWQLYDTDNNDGNSRPSLQRFLLSLTRNEFSILEQCLYIPPTNEDPRAAWNKIQGIPDIQQSIMDRLHAMNFCPQHNPYAPILMDNHAGLLLYGPPGCGKTMLLQAVCATMRAPCLIVTPSVLLKKYVGETNSLIRSLFQLGQKLGGCVICLDELDGLFRERRQDEHDSARELKTEFMQWWDGLKNDHTSRILIVGATNRPFDVDPAILRRMSQSHFVGLPMGQARQVILQTILSQLPTSPDINLTEIVQSTEGFAPSDLMQMVRTAAQQGPLREGRGKHSNFRPLTQRDLELARQQVGPTPLSNDYRNALIQFHQQQRQHQPPQQSQQQLAVQTTPWGNFYNAGTFSLEGMDDDESDANAVISEEENLEELDDDWDEDQREADNSHSEDEDL